MLKPHELEISRAEYDALLKTRELLKSNIVPQRPDEFSDVVSPVGVVFDMDNSATKFECGTALCIGGFMKLFMMGVKPDDNGEFLLNTATTDIISDYVMRTGDSRSSGLHKLFYPVDIEQSWSHITAEEAVEAIDNYLETGRPDWKDVVAEQ